MIKKDQASTLPTYLVFAFLSYSANSAAYLVRIFRAEVSEDTEKRKNSNSEETAKRNAKIVTCGEGL
jgi:hypothetical protein